MTSRPQVTPVPVVKTDFGQQATRAAIAFVLALGAVLECVSANQKQIETLFPNVKWLGAALLAGGLVARMLQELLLVFNIHTVAGQKK